MANDKIDPKVLTREIGAMSRRAEFSPESLDETARTVDLIWTTGSRVTRGLFERYEEELSLDPDHVRMERLQGGAPLLDNHRHGEAADVIGVVESASLEKTRGVATVRFSEDPGADAVFRKVKERVLRNVSVGYRVHRLEKLESGSDKLPVYRATDWEPHELSIVPVGADAAATVRNAGATNLCEFVTLEEEIRMSKKTEEIATPNPAPVAAPAVQEVDTAKIRSEAMAEERSRLEMIQRTAKTLDLADDFVARHISEGTAEDSFRAAAFDEYEARKAPVVDDIRPAVAAGEDKSEKWLRGASNWLITRAAAGGLIETAAKAKGETVDLDPGEFRGLSLVDMARESLQLSGVNVRGLNKMDLVGKALTHRAGGMQTTSDFPVLLENTLHKILLASYGVTPDTWSRFCAVGSVSDFRAHNRYRMGTFGALDTVAEHGEFTNKNVPDARKESITAATKGNIVGLSRQAIINDDMSAFSRLASMLGRMARLSIESDVYALLAQNGGLGPNMNDGNPLFDASHSNLGAGAAITIASIDENRVVMASQTDESGNEFLDLRPSAMVIAVGLGGEARALNDAQYDTDTAGALKPNSVRGLFNDIVDTPRITGTRRYLFADPAIAPTIEVAFLDGQQAPFLDTQDGWRIDGVEWKVRLDYAVGAVDYRGAVTDAGA